MRPRKSPARIRSTGKSSVSPFLLVFLAILALPRQQAFGAPGDIVFPVRVPNAYDFTTADSTFGNQKASVVDAPRGGGMYIRYANGHLRNLTQAAGLGSSGFQGANSIAVRDPAVHWSGNKIIFSMVVGSPTQQFQVAEYRWQLYEMSGLGENETPVVSKLPNQPAAFNNVMPTYAADDQILFISDRPRDGSAHLYPQRDEYESAPTNSGLWRLNPVSGELVLLDHAPSGAFHPIVDSFGRVIYTRWDHLQRDQQAAGLTDYGAFNYASESADAARIANDLEVFPEPRAERERVSATLNLHTFNHFFPWQINEDGTEHETLNHIGRHELHGYFNRTFNDDDNLEEFYGQFHRTNPNNIQNFFQIREDPLHAGRYFGIDAPEFSTHAAGQIVSMDGAPTIAPDQMVVTYVTARATASTSSSPGADHSGLYRNPLPMSDGTLVAAHTSETREDRNDGTRAAPTSRYFFRIKRLKASGSVMIPDVMLTSGINASVSFWDPDVMVSYSGPLWEMQPVELIARQRPPARSPSLADPERQMFSQAGVDVETFRTYLRQNNLALIVSRNVLTRDAADIQQPFNLHVAGTNTTIAPVAGKIYDIAHLQIFQGDQIRGYGGTADPDPGRRVLAQPLHDAISVNPANPTGPAGSVRIGTDGSMAAIVPARRALTWQLTDPTGNGIVRERYWLTFQPGEIRVCASCHGLNNHDQAGNATPQNAPLALLSLLSNWAGNPSPPNDPPPGGGTFSIAASSIKRKQEVSGLIPRAQGIIRVTGSAGAPTIAGTLTASIDGTACPAPVESIQVGASVTDEVRGKIPSSRRTVGVQFALVDGNGVTQSTLSLSLGGGTRGKPMKPKEIAKICKALAKFH